MSASGFWAGHVEDMPEDSVPVRLKSVLISAAKVRELMAHCAYHVGVLLRVSLLVSFRSAAFSLLTMLSFCLRSLCGSNLRLVGMSVLVILGSVVGLYVRQIGILLEAFMLVRCRSSGDLCVD